MRIILIVYFTKIAPNYINKRALRKNSADIGLTLRIIAPKKNYFFFGEMHLLIKRKPGAIQVQNTIGPYFNKLFNIINKQLFLPNKKIIIKIS